MVKRGWLIDKDRESHATDMKALASQHKNEYVLQRIGSCFVFVLLVIVQVSSRYHSE